MFENLPVGSQWTLSPDDTRAIAADYGLTIVASDSPVLSGAVNGVAHVETSVGSVVIRVHRPWTTPARLTALHGLLAALREAGIPVPRVLRTHAGTTWTRLADRLVEVVAYVPSDHTADTWARSGPAFAMLARLHAALARVPIGVVPAPPYSSYATPATMLTMLAETEEVFVALAPRPGYPEAAAVRAATGALLRALAAEHRRYASSLPRGLVHGDYGGDNVLLRGELVVAILDFDFLGERERVFDLAYALYHACDRFCSTRNAALPPATCFAHAATLLGAYRRHTETELTATELAALPFEMARVPLYQLAEAGYLTEAETPGGAVEQTLRYARHLPVAEALATHATHITNLLVGEAG